MNKLIRPARQALAQKYGYKNVSVKNGAGTAWGGVEVSIAVKRTLPCLGDNPFYCHNCATANGIIKAEARKIMQDAWDKEELKPYTFYSDDGYDTELDEVFNRHKLYMKGGENIRMSGYMQAIKRPQHNMISTIVEELRKCNQEGERTYSDDFIMGFEMALRSLVNANGSFVERLSSLVFRHI